MRFGSAEDNSSDQRRRTGQFESQMFKRGSRRDGDGSSLDAFPEMTAIPPPRPSGQALSSSVHPGGVA